MEKNILKLKNITKNYRNKKAIENIDMTIKKGDIYGLIGKNGAGKTTLTRIITSLDFADNGTIELFGETTEKGLQKARKKLGCVIEMPALYPTLTAYQNLQYYQKLRGVSDKNVITKTLEMVSLSNTGKMKVKDFSLGMKQRLGIALALLSHPEFLILDEPINGLDPTGIIEIRNLIKQLNEEHNITILISSHLLTELSLVATRYGFIDNGKIIKELTQEQLNEACSKSLSIMVDNIKGAELVIQKVLKTQNYKVISDKEIRLYDYLDNSSEVTFQLVSNGIRVLSASEVGENLEDYFLSLIKEAV